jgi:hypothetical protein
MLTDDLKNKLEEIYFSGKCFYLAIALHRLYGYEIQASLNTDNVDDIWIEHAWCIHPNGNILDITGLHQFPCFQDNIVKNLNEDGILQYIKGGAKESQILEAEVVINDFLNPEYLLENKQSFSKAQTEKVLIAIKDNKKISSDEDFNPILQILNSFLKDLEHA